MKDTTEMNSDRIKEIQMTTAFPESENVKKALLQVWNECEQEKKLINVTKEKSKISQWIDVFAVFFLGIIVGVLLCIFIINPH